MPNGTIKFFLPLAFGLSFLYASAQIKIGGNNKVQTVNPIINMGGDTNRPAIMKPPAVRDTTNNKLNLEVPKEYELGADPTVIGAQHMDVAVLLLISGLTKGEKIEIPGTKITDAIKNIWKQGLFENVQIYASKIEGKKIYLTISVVEKPRLSKYTFIGLKKGEVNKLKDELKLVRGKVVTDYLLADIRQTIIQHYTNNGYSNIKLDITEKTDTTFSNSVILYIKVDREKELKYRI